jgi:hypothetical protein
LGSEADPLVAQMLGHFLGAAITAQQIDIHLNGARPLQALEVLAKQQIS